MMTFHLKAHNQSRYSKFWLTHYMMWETLTINMCAHQIPILGF